MGLANAVEDLQEISRGIHPAILSTRSSTLGCLEAPTSHFCTGSQHQCDTDVDQAAPPFSFLKGGASSAKTTFAGSTTRSFMAATAGRCRVSLKQALNLQTNTLWLSDAGECADVPLPAAERARRLIHCSPEGR
jgi:hypothetical protein